MSFGEQYLPAVQMHEKLRMAIAVLRSQPNRWKSLSELDREIGCGALMARFPVVWRSHVLKSFGTSASASAGNLATFKCRYRAEEPEQQQQSKTRTHHHHHHHHHPVDKKQQQQQEDDESSSPVDPSRFELQYSAPTYRDIRDMTKHLRNVSSQRNQQDGGLFCAAVPVDSLASGKTRPQSLAVVQQAVDMDWCYVVSAQRPPNSVYNINSAAAAAAAAGGKKDATSASSMANATAHLLKGKKGGVRRQRGGGADGGGDRGGGGDDEGGGRDNTGSGDTGGGGGGGGGGGSYMVSGLQQSTAGTRGIAAALQEQFHVSCHVSTKVLNSGISFPDGVFLPQQMQLPANVTSSSSSASASSKSKQQQQPSAVQQQKSVPQQQQDESDTWLIHLSRPLETSDPLAPELPSIKISIAADPAAAFDIFPIQVTVPAQKAGHSSKEWQGLFRVKPLRESKAQLTVSIITVQQQQQQAAASTSGGSASSSSMAASAAAAASAFAPAPQSNFSCEIQVKRRFAVDDQSLHRAPPVLYYRGIGSTSLLPALGIHGHQSSSAGDDDDGGGSEQQQKGQTEQAQTAAAAVDKRLVAESVRRSMEPIPALVQCTAAGATYRPSQDNMARSEQAVFLSASAAAASGKGLSLLDRQLLQQQRRQRLELERHQRQEKERLLQLQQVSNEKKRFKNFTNPHMLHLGIDTRKPYSAGKELREQQEQRGMGARPLEPMDMVSLI